jgi:predicted Zn-dependent protease
VDPVSLTLGCAVGWTFSMSRRFDESIAEYRRVLAMDATFPMARREYAILRVQVGRFDEAADSLAGAARQASDGLLLAGIAAQIQARAGRADRAAPMLDRLQRCARSHALVPQLVAAVCATLGRADEAFLWLNQAIDRRSPTLIWLGVDPWFDPVRGDDRFHRALDVGGLRR